MKADHSIRQFDHDELGSLRVWRDDDGQPWFLACDVLAILGRHGNVTQATRYLLSDEKRSAVVDIGTSPRKVTVVSDGGVCVLAIRSTSRNREALQRWVSSEIVPKYRAAGGRRPMTAEEMLEDPDVMIAVLEAYKREREKNEHPLPWDEGTHLATMTVSVVRDGDGIRFEMD